MIKSKNTFISEDVKNLFKSFGGNPEAYQEVPTVVGAVRPDVSTSPQDSLKKDHIQAAPIQTNAAQSVQKSGGIFKPRKSQLTEVVEQALPVAEVEAVNDDEYMARLAGSPWLGKHLMLHVANSTKSIAAGDHVEIPEKTLFELKAAQQSSKDRLDSKVQIFVEPKPITEVFNVDKMSSPLDVASFHDKIMTKK